MNTRFPPRASAIASASLAMVARVHVPAIALVLANGVLVLRCRPAARESLARAFAQLPEDAAFALIGSPEPTANGRLVWQPGQTSPAAITPPGSGGECLTGAMLLVAAGVDEDRVSIREDGFALLARADTWARVREALLAGREHNLPATGAGFALRVEQIPDGWDRYEPVGGARGTEQIVLLTPEDQLRTAIDVDQLSAYLRQLIDAMAGLHELAVRIELQPEVAPRFASRGHLPDSVGAALLDIEPPVVRGPVAFEIHCKPGDTRAQ